MFRGLNPGIVSAINVSSW